MAGEFKHASVGTDLSQAEWESTAGHVLNNQATGDLVYASSASQLSRLPVGTSNTVLTVSGGIPTWITPSNSESAGVRTDFRNNIRQIAQYLPGNASGSPIMGFGTLVYSGGTLTGISGEPIQLVANTTFGTCRIQSGAAAGNLAPNKSPRMLWRGQLPAASANVTYVNIGFYDASGTAPNGAYLRIVTTGNVFFVTRQGASETTTDLGALSRTTIIGFEIETADAGVTWKCRNQAGTELASHTTNVPTAATGLDFGFTSVIATAAVPHGVSMIYIEGTFA